MLISCFKQIGGYYTNFLKDETMRCDDQVPIKILVIYNPCLYLPYNTMLNIYKKVIKVLESRRFHLIYLLFYIKQVMKVLKDKRFFLSYLTT